MLHLPKPFAADPGFVNAIVETPKGSRNKYNFQPETGLFFLKRVLPLGAFFPLDFGFIPQTLAPDGDPLDVLILADDPCAVGALLECRLLGIIEAEQQTPEHPKPFRNDRLVAVSRESREHARLQNLHDLGDEWLQDIVRFFAQYHDRDGGAFKALAFKDAAAAWEAVKNTTNAWKHLKPSSERETRCGRTRWRRGRWSSFSSPWAWSGCPAVARSG